MTCRDIYYCEKYDLPAIKTHHPGLHLNLARYHFVSVMTREDSGHHRSYTVQRGHGFLAAAN